MSQRRRRRVVILGASGSIGSQALDLIDRFPDHFELAGLASGRRPISRPGIPATDLSQPDHLARMAAMVGDADVDVVLVAIPGAMALEPTVIALEAGRRVALATKEVLVMAGRQVMELAARGGDPLDHLCPVDSEHSAIWQCLWGESMQAIERLTLTASGGPFWGDPERDLEAVTVAEALEHPRWRMGPKVTIDSATLMNKGLELIEAHHLYGVAPDRIDVVIHPQAVVHSLVHFVDGSVKAQLGQPDMRLPIAVALAHPVRLPGAVPPSPAADFGALDFFATDPLRHRAITLARAAAASRTGHGAVFNAANEVAVELFVTGRISFARIVGLVEASLEEFEGTDDSMAGAIEADSWAREFAAGLAARQSG